MSSSLARLVSSSYRTRTVVRQQGGLLGQLVLGRLHQFEDASEEDPWLAEKNFFADENSAADGKVRS